MLIKVILIIIFNMNFYKVFKKSTYSNLWTHSKLVNAIKLIIYFEYAHYLAIRQLINDHFEQLKKNNWSLF